MSSKETSSNSFEDNDGHPDFTAYDDQDLLEIIAEDICEGDAEQVGEVVAVLLAHRWRAPDILQEALLLGLWRIVQEYEAGAVDMRQVWLASEAFAHGLDILKARWPRPCDPPLGQVMLAGVWGDAHTFGLDICALYLQLAGFEVHNLGGSQRVQEIVTAVQTVQPQVLILTTAFRETCQHLSTIITALRDNHLRQSLYILLGGGAIEPAHIQEMGADDFCADWHTAVRLVQQHLRT